MYKEAFVYLAIGLWLPTMGTAAIATAYCPCKKCCGPKACGITASGHKIRPGDKFVAADKSIPFGTMVTIPGYGRVPVLDRGGKIKKGHYDVYFPTHKEALQWGVKKF
jgi:3D (Asp-Asp-Asp) domain-containing protein